MDAVEQVFFLRRIGHDLSLSKHPNHRDHPPRVTFPDILIDF